MFGADHGACAVAEGELARALEHIFGARRKAGDFGVLVEAAHEYGAVRPFVDARRL